MTHPTTKTTRARSRPIAEQEPAPKRRRSRRAKAALALAPPNLRDALDSHDPETARIGRLATRLGGKRVGARLDRREARRLLRHFVREDRRAAGEPYAGALTLQPRSLPPPEDRTFPCKLNEGEVIPHLRGALIVASFHAPERRRCNRPMAAWNAASGMSGA
jgi:hypothetical protein